MGLLYIAKLLILKDILVLRVGVKRALRPFGATSRTTPASFHSVGNISDPFSLAYGSSETTSGIDNMATIYNMATIAPLGCLDECYQNKGRSVKVVRGK
jgi:hypothetical protein